MKIRITSSRHILPVGTILNVGDIPPRAWNGKYEVVIDEPKAEPEPEEYEGEVKDARPWRKPKPG